MDDIVFYCRVKGDVDWERVSEHPWRPMKDVAELYAQSKAVDLPVIIEVKKDNRPGVNYRSFEV